jgi:hypothetical protein
MTQAVQNLPSKCKDLSSKPQYCPPQKTLNAFKESELLIKVKSFFFLKNDHLSTDYPKKSQ